jgi:hypothetical protein
LLSVYQISGFLNRKDYTKKYNSLHLSKEIIGGHLVENIPYDISVIINKFVKDRPQKNRGINIDIFLTKETVASLIETKKIGDKLPIKITKIIRSVEEDLISSRCTIYFFEFKKELIGEYEGKDAFLLGIDDDSFCLITNYRRPDHDKVCKWISYNLFPLINKAFITSSEMYDILMKMEKQGKYDLRVKMDYYRVKDMSRSLTEYFRARQPDKLPKIDEIFEEKKISKSYMRMMKIVSIHEKKDIGITFTGAGHVGLYDGTFDDIFDYLIIPTIEKSKVTLKNFNDRSMEKTKNKKPRPIKLSFFTEVFGSKDDVIDFIERLNSKYRRFSYSVVHGGNPHLFMYILDKYDLSSFSLRSVGNDSLIITPQIKTSPESLMRFTDCLLSLHPDGEICEV